MVNYFIYFTVRSRSRPGGISTPGDGNNTIARQKPITNHADIKEIERLLLDDVRAKRLPDVASLVISNIIRLPDTEESIADAEPVKIWQIHKDTFYAGRSLGQIIDYRIKEGIDLGLLFDPVWCGVVPDEHLDDMIIDGTTHTFREALRLAITDDNIPCCVSGER